MASYDKLSYNGSYSYGGRNVFLYLYPDRNDEDWMCESANAPIPTAIEYACNQLLNANAIDYWEMNFNDDHPRTYATSKSEFQDEFYSWLDNYGDYRNYTGAHIGICDGYDHAGAEVSGDGTGSTAFTNAIGADVGTAGPQDKWQNFAVQEPFHVFINSNEPEVANMINEGSHMHEHDLGTVYPNGDVTPLATLYEDTHARHDNDGQGCSSIEVWDGGYDYSVTSCTIDAVAATAETET